MLELRRTLSATVRQKACVRETRKDCGSLTYSIPPPDNWDGRTCLYMSHAVMHGEQERQR